VNDVCRFAYNTVGPTNY